MKQHRQWMMPVLVMLAFLLIWEMCVHLFNIALYILPAPSDIVSAMLECAPQLWVHSLVTLQEAIIGLILALILAVVLAVLMDLSKTIKHSIFPH